MLSTNNFEQNQLGSQTLANDQGFEAQHLSIQQHGQQQQKLQIIPHEGNELITNTRPKDLLPRSIYTSLPLKAYELQLNITSTFSQTHRISPSLHEYPLKPKKYPSLQQKYKNSSYPLIYSKFSLHPSLSYYHNSYINLQKIVDYSPSDFATFTYNQQLNTNTSLFDSNFQSGNLLYAYQTGECRYDLILQNDTNTRGYNQWFYFSYRFEKARQVNFTVVNMIKKKSLFSLGVKPCFYVMEEKVGKEWKQVTSDVKYYKNGILRQNGKYYYTLQFTYHPSTSSKVYFSLNLPYTYTKLVTLLKQLQLIFSPAISITRHTLCYSISNNEIPYLTIKSRNHTPTKQILFFARQHPGETISSYIIQALIRAIVVKNKLTEKFEIIVVPMLNVDGVIYGNFRTNLAGYDINRQWKNTNKWMNPEVYYLKKLIQKQNKLEFVLDFHGHSKKFNSFIYACKQQDRFEEKIFPYLMSRNSLFKVESCTYGLSKDKMTTARAYIKGLGINHIYTLETSFYGFSGEDGEGKKEYHRFEQKHYASLGATIVQSLEELYLTKCEELKKYQHSISQIVQRQQKLFDNEYDDSGSDSNPDQDQLSQTQRQTHVIPIQVLEQKQFKETEKNINKIRRNLKNIKFEIKNKEKRKSKEKKSEHLYDSSKELNNYQKQKEREKVNLRNSYEYKTARSYNKQQPTAEKSIEPVQSFKTSLKVMRENKQEESITNKLKKIVINKKNPKQLKQLPSNKKIQQKSIDRNNLSDCSKDKLQQKSTSSLFYSSIRRNSIKQKRVHKSMMDQRIISLTKQQNQMIAKYKQKHTSNLKQPLNSLTVIQTKYNLKNINKLDKIIQQRIHQKITQSAFTTMPKVKKTQYNTGVTMGDQSNLLERSCLSNGYILDGEKEDVRESVSKNARRTRNHRNKKELVFLSQLMRPKVEYGKGYQIEVIGCGNDSRSQGKRSSYFNNF